MSSKVQVYEDSAQGWRWRLVTSNGRIIAISSEAYADKHNAVEAFITTRDVINSVGIPGSASERSEASDTSEASDGPGEGGEGP